MSLFFFFFSENINPFLEEETMIEVKKKPKVKTKSVTWWTSKVQDPHHFPKHGDSQKIGKKEEAKVVRKRKVRKESLDREIESERPLTFLVTFPKVTGSRKFIL